MHGRAHNGIVKPRLVRVHRRRLSAVAVEMSERQQDLDRERKKCEPRSVPDV
jgi:hypothetical protein